MKVKMQRKTASIREWYETEVYTQTLYGDTEKDDAVIVKRVTLGDAEFKNFCDGFLTDRPWIAESCEQTICDKNGLWHVLAVTSKNSDITVLVAAEGFSYARYTAVMPKRKKSA
jgi:hypothetical protein